MALAIGVDVGGTKVLAAAIDTDTPTKILRAHRVPTPPGTGVIDAITELVARLQDEATAAGHGPVVGVGVGLPGLVAPDGVLLGAPHLPDLVGLPLRSTLATTIGLPVTLDNDANCAAWAEVVCGVGRGTSEVLVVTLGTGIGGGLVIDGTLRHGAHGAAGEPGHMVIDPNGPPCPCGRRGCWERYASGSGLGLLGQVAAAAGEAPALLARAGSADAVRGEDVVAAAREGDRGARAVIESFADWLGMGLANLVTLLDPELVVVGGGLADVADLFVDRARQAMVAQALGAPTRPPARLEIATLGSDAGVIGAALVAVPPAEPAFARR